MGSICDARWAGTAAAMIDTVIKRSVVQAPVRGSAAPRPYNMDPIDRTSESAAPSPVQENLQRTNEVGAWVVGNAEGRSKVEAD
jgi:hypothetical protein